MKLENFINSEYKTEEVPISISNRHVHLTEDIVEVLFGKNYELKKTKDISQPGQYACNEKIDVVTKKGFVSCRVVGPCRSYVQVEVSGTEAIKLGLDPPIRLAGNIEGSASATLIGPQGEYFLKEGVIISARHVHLSNEEAERFELKHGDVVNLAVNTERGYHTLGNLICRAGKGHKLDVHIDTDEANAIGLKNCGKGNIFYK